MNCGSLIVEEIFRSLITVKNCKNNFFQSISVICEERAESHAFIDQLEILELALNNRLFNAIYEIKSQIWN